MPTVELPDIKASSEAEAQKQAEERARIMEEARSEAEIRCMGAAGEAVLSAARRRAPARLPACAGTGAGRPRYRK